MSLVEAAAIVCVVGVVLAIFVPSFIAELRTSKTSEAVQGLQLMSQRASAYFTDIHPVEEAPSVVGCLPPTAGPTPRAPTVEPEHVEFQSVETPGHETWRALAFQPRVPVRYAYSFEPAASGCGLRSPEGSYLVTLRAEGDLDEDGERSLFELRMAADEEGELYRFGVLYVRDRVE